MEQGDMRLAVSYNGFQPSTWLSREEMDRIRNKWVSHLNFSTMGAQHKKLSKSKILISKYTLRIDYYGVEDWSWEELVKEGKSAYINKIDAAALEWAKTILPKIVIRFF